MTILGKVLAIINILAALAFVYLAATDWAKRQTWSYAVYRQDLYLNGLPIDEQETDAEGVREVDKLSDQTFQDLFKSVGGAPSSPLPEDRTQVAEVKRIYTRFQQEFGGMADAQKREKLAAILVPLGRTGGERDALVERIRKATPDDLNRMPEFEKAFDAVTGTNSPHGWEPGERRAAVAHLLFNLINPASPDYQREYQRVLVVVGLKSFTAEANRQARALQEMSERVRLAMAVERNEFEQQHQRLLGDLRVLAENLEQRKAKQAEHERLTKKHQDLYEVRVNDVRELQDKIEAMRKAARQALDKLAEEQKILFKEQQKVVKTAAENQRLEREIRALENVGP
jgi:hypothetical protein